MHISRNLASHTYDEEIAREIIKEIRNTYFGLLNDLFQHLKGKKENEI
jgi:hypothetical protein